MYDTKYSGKTPKKVGEARGAKFAPDGAAPEYQQRGSSRKYGNSSASVISTHKSKHKLRNPFLNGGGNKQVSLNPSNSRHSSFKSEGARSTLISPTSRPPKAK